MDDKVYYPETIQDIPFPGQVVQSEVVSEASANGIYSPSIIPEKSFPTKKIAVELIGQALNTRSRKILGKFNFEEKGALQIGKYVNGVSGDVRISPNGLTARNQSGINTFALDGDTGDAYFAGIIQGGTLIGGKVAVGDGDIVIDGDNKRMVFFDDNGIPVIIIGNA